jgi:hypothetical protein
MAGEILGIALIDRLITGEGKYISLKKEKLLVLAWEKDRKTEKSRSGYKY